VKYFGHGKTLLRLFLSNNQDSLKDLWLQTGMSMSSIWDDNVNDGFLLQLNIFVVWNTAISVIPEIKASDLQILEISRFPLEVYKKRI